MTGILAKLREDHRHLVEIFDLIERELRGIETGEAGEVGPLSDILDYIKYYPEVFHHPLEDLVFDCLARRPASRPLVTRLQDEHMRLTEMTKELRDALGRAAETGAAADRGRVARLGHAFLDAQRVHMRAEEETAFPEALRLLTADEWDRVQDYAAAAAPEADPVFGPAVTARYRALRQRIEDRR